nr:phycoerythrin beta subunit [Cavernulicola chilensis]
MLDAFARVVVNSENQGNYIKSDDLQSLKTLVLDSNKRLNLVNSIVSSASYIVSDALSGVLCENPYLLTNNSNSYTNWEITACVRDGEMILRYISYALLAGDSSILNDCYLHGLKDTYKALGISVSSVIRTIAIMKASTLVLLEYNFKNQSLQSDSGYILMSKELSDYFDYIIVALWD